MLEKGITVADVRGNILPIYFVADESYSMSDVVEDLNKGLVSLLDALNLETLAAAKVRLSVIGFSDNAICHLPMSDVREVTQMPTLSTRGETSYGSAFRELLSKIPADVQSLKSQGYAVHRPAVFFLTDGQPTDNGNWEQALSDLKSQNFRQRPNILAFGIGEAKAETILLVASKPDFAYVAAVHTDTGAGIAKFCEMLTQSIITSGQALAEDRSELVGQRPDGFSMAIDLV